MREMKLQDLKSKTPTEPLSFAEELEVENASTMRKQELMFAILKQLAGREIDIIGEGVVEVLSDGFGSATVTGFAHFLAVVPTNAGSRIILIFSTCTIAGS